MKTIEEKISNILGEAFMDVDTTSKVVFQKDFIAKIFKDFRASFFDAEEDDLKPISNRLIRYGLGDDEVNEIRDLFTSIIKDLMDKKQVKYTVNKNSFGVYIPKGYNGRLMRANGNDWFQYDEYNYEDLMDEVEKKFRLLYDKRLTNRKYGKAL